MDISNIIAWMHS